MRLKEFFSNHNKFPSNSAVTVTEGTEDPDDLTVAFERKRELSSRLSAGPRTPFRGKSTFIPPHKRNASINTYCRLVEKDVSLLLGKKRDYKVANNLSKDQRMELNSIKNDKSLVIQSADKGGAIVVMDRTAYDMEIQRQLSNTIFYNKLNRNPTQEFKQRIRGSWIPSYKLQNKNMLSW